MVAIDRACVFLAVFESSGHFAVNILSEHQRDLSDRFAQLPEGPLQRCILVERCHGIAGHRRSLASSNAKTRQVLDAGDHRVFIGEAVAVGIGEGRPLVFFASDTRGSNDPAVLVLYEYCAGLRAGRDPRAREVAVRYRPLR